MTQQDMCFNVGEMKIGNREALKIILKKSERNKCRYLERTKEKEKKEERQFWKKETVFVKGRRTESKIKHIIEHTGNSTYRNN